MDGLDFEDENVGPGKILTWEEFLYNLPVGAYPDFVLVRSTHVYMRSFLFRKFADIPQYGLLDSITENTVPWRPHFLYGAFYEGLVAFQLARQASRGEYLRKGEAALMLFRDLTVLNNYNFENKHIILEAEFMCVSGYHGQASQLYKDAVRSANEHKFLHEEAIAAELAGVHAYEQGMHENAVALLMHSVQCFKDWGAAAIAKRVETFISCNFNLGAMNLVSVEGFLASILAPTESSARKRQEYEGSRC